MPARRINRQTHIVFIFLLFLLAPIHFIHLFPHFSTHILGDVMDTAIYPLNEWWTAHALLDLKTNPFQNNYQFYPVGLNMVQHTYNFIDGFLYTLFRPWVPLLVFHNLLTWVSVFANALAAYHLFQVDRYRWAIGSGILLGLSVYNYPYYFVGGLVWFGVLVTYRLFPWTVKVEPDEQTGKFLSPWRVLVGWF